MANNKSNSSFDSTFRCFSLRYMDSDDQQPYHQLINHISPTDFLNDLYIYPTKPTNAYDTNLESTSIGEKNLPCLQCKGKATCQYIADFQKYLHLTIRLGVANTRPAYAYFPHNANHAEMVNWKTKAFKQLAQSTISVAIICQQF